MLIERHALCASLDDRILLRRALVRTATISVVIPALNEAQNLQYVLPRIPPNVHEVILVDGASSDGTIDAARRVMPNIRIVAQVGRGKGAALRAGFAAATGDIIVHLDADGSTDPEEIPAFVGCLLAGADYAKGTRFMQGATTTDMTRLRRLGNWGFVRLTNFLFRTRFSDITYGYNAVWRDHRDKLASEIDGWAYEIVGNIRATRHGLRVVEVASRESPRLAGQAKLKTFSAGWAILLAIIAERLRPLPRTSPAQPSQYPAMVSIAIQPEGGSLFAQPIQLRLLEPSADDTQAVAVAVPVFTNGSEPLPTHTSAAASAAALPVAAETWSDDIEEVRVPIG